PAMLSRSHHNPRLIQSCDQRGEEFAQNGRPFGVFLTAWQMTEIAIDFKVARVDPGSRESPHHPGGDRRRKKPIGPEQHIKDSRLNFGKVLDRVVPDGAASQNDQRVCVPLPGPVDRLLANLRLTRVAIREARGERRLDAVALHHLDPGPSWPLPYVIPATVPFGIAGEAGLQLGEATLNILRPGRGYHRDNAIEKSG